MIRSFLELGNARRTSLAIAESRRAVAQEGRLLRGGVAGPKTWKRLKEIAGDVAGGIGENSFGF
jgi:hypothetical protein